MRPILQTELSECGLASLAMIAAHYGYHESLASLRRRFSISTKGTTLNQIMKHAGMMNLSSRPLRLELAEIDQLKLPAILHWDLNHFIVLKKISKNLNGKLVATILDPATGERKLNLREISQHFTGIALELTPTPDFEQKEEARQISIKELTGKVFGLRRAIIQVIILAIALEIFIIVSPLFNQFVLDEAIAGGDRELLNTLTIGFVLLLFTQTSIGLARSWVIMRWSIDVGLQWSTRVFAHLTKLPVSYFEKRHLGDIVSRFGSMNSIQGTLTSLFVESLIDGLMTFFSLIMMLVYSPKLSIIVITCVTFYGILRWVSYSPLRDASLERLILSAKENTHFLETIRAIIPIKLFSKEADRRARWLNLKQDVINRDIKTQKIAILFKICNSIISGLQGILVFYVGANLVMDNILTIGMLLAFVSYSATFSSRALALTDLSVNVKMLGMHAERLADIVKEPIERGIHYENDLSQMPPEITLRNIRFRYADGEPWVLDGINLHIPAGQSLALTGASGCGKTTLCKVILGLLQPTEGEILINNIPISQIGLGTYRQIIGTVMQDDVLLAGSISDNISFFDDASLREEIIACAKKASIHDDIMATPMGYQTLIGDMGSSLSGGQKQRILLARALYKKPKILALDEATSHLDLFNEEKVNQAISELQLTRLIVAHRQETIDSAERVILMQHGKTIELNLCERDSNCQP